MKPFFVIIVSISWWAVLKAETSYFETFAIRQDLAHAQLRVQISQRQLEDKDWDYQHYDIGFNFDLERDWSVAAHVRLIYRKNDNAQLSGTEWDLEKRPYIQATKSYSSDYAKFTLRNRYEYRIRHNDTESKRLRTRAELTPERELYGVKTFVSSELFYDFDKHQSTKNRLTVGLKLPQISAIYSKIYYRHIQDRDDAAWLASNSLGFKVECKF